MGELQKVGFHRIEGDVRCLSGLRIGGGDDLLAIGGTDLTCIKDPVTLKPYIPGSSLKGRMRSELELYFALVDGSEPFGTSVRGPARRASGARPISDLTEAEYLLCVLFGPHKTPDHAYGPSRALFRDGQLRSGGALEYKSEVMSERSTGIGRHPRSQERVTAGSVFRLKIDVHVLELDRANAHGKCQLRGKTGGEALVEFLRVGLALVERTGLGAGVSRGSGEVAFENLGLDGRPLTLEDALKCP